MVCGVLFVPSGAFRRFLGLQPEFPVEPVEVDEAACSSADTPTRQSAPPARDAIAVGQCSGMTPDEKLSEIGQSGAGGRCEVVGTVAGERGGILWPDYLLRGSPSRIAAPTHRVPAGSGSSPLAWAGVREWPLSAGRK
jgi:hypothetical protein